mmetsp:Transcript_35952/g.66026  ORF Transcript_35952/g.66026 Transcript_35952/m.66026 type:complete len:137 (-) Transcript_35952:89-499(-)
MLSFAAQHRGPLCLLLFVGQLALAGGLSVDSQPPRPFEPAMEMVQENAQTQGDSTATVRQRTSKATDASAAQAPHYAYPPLVTNNLKLDVGKNLVVDPHSQEETAELWSWSSKVLGTTVTAQDRFEMGMDPWPVQE